MSRVQEIGSGLLAGALAGLLVLGIGGRVVMRTVALVAGQPGGFSAGGTLEVLLVGALYGGLGGLVYALLPRKGLPSWVRGPGVGVVLFGLAVITSEAGRRAAATVPELRSLVLGLFGVLFLAYGVLVHAVRTRWAVRQATVPPAGAGA